MTPTSTPAAEWMERLAVHPAADPLRAEPRVRALLEALRLPELS